MRTKYSDLKEQIQVSFPKRQLKLLRDEAKFRGVPVAEILRRIVDQYFDAKNSTRDSLVRGEE